MDEYPQGTNAIVAVIAYTGYDMEDAMIISKAAYERGFCHGSMYKTAEIDLDEEEKKGSSDGVRPSLRLGLPVVRDESLEHLDEDGLPHEGLRLTYGQALCCLVDTATGLHKIVKHKETEDAYVDTVRVLGTGSSAKKPAVRKVSITMRYKRNPIIGDKFSSRHGQKGTLSVLWPQENMVSIYSIYRLICNIWYGVFV
jgi:DNA-directed RNA polymerase I subunit RPA2